MNKLILFTIAFFILSNINAQVTKEGIPASFTLTHEKSSSDINSRRVYKVKPEKQIKKDEHNNISNRYAINRKVSIDIKKKGKKIKTVSGTIWQYRLTSKNSKYLAIIFSEFHIPDGGKLFQYNPEKEIVRGAFTSQNNKMDGVLALADFPGETVILEYYEPDNVDFEGTLVIGNVGRAYRDIHTPIVKSVGADGHININCEEGLNYQEEKHAVAKMTYKVGTDRYFCSGALINNTRNDGTPYFLTANHCISVDEAASTLITYYNYEQIGCDGAVLPIQSLSGSEIVSMNELSDFSLLLLTETPPVNYRPYYTGWNIQDDDYVVGGYGIHHPGGKVKKISLVYDSISSFASTINWGAEYPVSQPHTHWILSFNEGMTEGGSSGSPLFDTNSRIIGQLHGGGESYDFYGKITSSWEAGTLDEERLKPHLDPDNLGVEVLDAYIPDEVVPEAFFVSDFTEVCQGEPISFNNGSAFAVTSHEWNFEPETVTFLEGTNINSVNPIVSFDNNGTYSVNLKVSNMYGSDSLLRTDYIVAGQTIFPKIKYEDTTAPYGYFDQLRFAGTGADSFQWSILTEIDKINYRISDNGDSLIISKKDGVVITNTTAIDIQLKGFHGSCYDSTIQTIYLMVVPGDFISDAIALEMGTNGMYDNYYATVEVNEPHPVIGDCVTPGEWCDCEVGGPYLDNSVWFTFIGPSSGSISINCPGFDNQIAVYDAEQAEDIISGNTSLFSIIAANDDYTLTNYVARVDDVSVTPGKKYWLQVDGSACGAVGEFQVILSEGSSSAVITNSLKKEQEFSIYPNPVEGEFTLQGIYEDDIIVELLSIDGKLIKVYDNRKVIANNMYHFNVPSGLSNGVYILNIKSGNIKQSMKLFVKK